ncbi:MAG: hypothetical protein Q8N04_07740 [Nitrospira sp.]|nr:hypothetical protein [Nitrospira sp.]
MNHRTSSTRSGASEHATCARCHGLMVPGFTESLLVEIAETSSALAWRCVNCGEWVDVMVVANRDMCRSAEPNHDCQPLAGRRRWR